MPQITLRAGRDTLRPEARAARRTPSSAASRARIAGPRVLSAVLAGWLLYVSDSGSVSATDDLRRVPAKHRAEVREVEAPRLECYPKATLIGKRFEGAASRCSSKSEERVAP